MGLPSKTMGKKRKVFLMKLKQTCVKLYGNKSKTAGSGASW